MSLTTTLRRPAAALLTSLALLAPAPSAQSASQTFIASEAFDQWGSTVAVVGDVDGDGLPDVAVGSPTASVTVLQFVFHNVGRVRVYSGLTGAVIHTWSGNAAGGTEFGFAIADAGDVNHDGFDDVLVSAPKDDGPATTGGQVRLYSGRTGGLLRTFYGLQTSARFGHSIDGGHDVDGDGTPDVLIGSPWRDLDGNFGNSNGEGQVELFSGADGSLLWLSAFYELKTYHPVFPFQGHYDIDEVDVARSGTAVAFLGDTNGNGQVAVAISAPESDYRRYSKAPAEEPVLLLTKLNVGLVHVREPFGAFIGSDFGDIANVRLGASMASLDGKISGGGGTGLAVTQTSAAATVLSLYHVGDLFGFSKSIEGTAAAPLGTAVSGLGDVDGDGFADVLAGLPQTSNGFPIGIPQVGSAKIYSGLTGELLQTFGGSQAQALLGSAVAGGDVNGDGVPDVLLGAPGHDGPLLDSGVAYLYLGEGCFADVAYYGAGWPGTLGIPLIAVDALPVLGTTVGLSVGNSRGVTTQAVLLIGLDSLSVTVKGGTLLVDALLSLPLVLPPGSIALPGSFPNDPALCGLSLYTQAIEADPGASHGASFTRGLRLDLGD